MRRKYANAPRIAHIVVMRAAESAIIMCVQRNTAIAGARSQSAAGSGAHVISPNRDDDDDDSDLHKMFQMYAGTVLCVVRVRVCSMCGSCARSTLETVRRPRFASHRARPGVNYLMDSGPTISVRARARASAHIACICTVSRALRFSSGRVFLEHAEPHHDARVRRSLV